MLSDIISGAALIIVALIGMLSAKESQSVKKQNEDNKALAELRHKESVLLLRLTYASGKLAEATARALQEGKVNGNVSEARGIFKDAEKRYNIFCQEHMKEDVT